MEIHTILIHNVVVTMVLFRIEMAVLAAMVLIKRK